MYIGVRVKVPILMKLEFYCQIFVKSSHTKFYENPSSGSRVVPRGRTDMTKLIVTFRNFANAPKNQKLKTPCTSFYIGTREQCN